MRSSSIKRSLVGSVIAFSMVLCASPSAGQEASMEMPPEMVAMMKAMMPGEPHQALAEAVGSFKMDFTFWSAPGMDPTKGEGMATRVMTNGGRILEESVKASTMGMQFEGVGQTGYDNVLGKHWATWVDTVSTGIYVSKETANENGTVTFDGASSDPMTGDMKPMKVVMHPEKDGAQRSEFFTPDGAGGEFKMMEITYTRESGS